METKYDNIRFSESNEEQIFFSKTIKSSTVSLKNNAATTITTPTPITYYSRPY